MLFRSGREAQAFWEKLARGETDEATLARLQEVAYEIVDAVFHAKFPEGGTHRAVAALKALGWHGKIDKYPGLAEFINEFPATSARGIAEVADLVLPDFPPDYDPKKAVKTVEAIKTRGKKR